MKTGSRRHTLARIGITLGAILLFAIISEDVRSFFTSLASGEYHRRVTSERLISAYLRVSKNPKLQLGAGTENKPDWLNTDYSPTYDQAYLDITKRFPLPEQSIRIVFSEHVIEHVPYEDGLRSLQESYRVLIPGGKIRIATPNLLRFIALFDDSKSQASSQFIPKKLAIHGWPSSDDAACYILNRQLRDFGHQFVYTPTMLAGALARAGFVNIKEYPIGESDDPDLQHLDARQKSDLVEVNDYEAMAFQATRPK